MSDLLHQLETYYDGVPRRFARVEECGPFTLFLGEPGGWTYYARPRLGGGGPFTAGDVAAALARLREEGLPQAIEWVHETTPDLLAAVRAEGTLDVVEVPLMVLTGDPPDIAPAAGVAVQVLTPSDGELVADAIATGHVGFDSPGTAIGDSGPVERDAVKKPPPQRVLDLIAAGAVVMAVARSERDGVVASGRALPVAGVAEIVGVATLPSARRQGLGAAVTVALVEALRAMKVQTIFLTASTEDVARVYARVGFERVGTGYIAEVGGH